MIGIKINSGRNTIAIEERKQGVFEIVDDDLIDRSMPGNTNDSFPLAFENWDGEAENLDDGSDVALCYGWSESLRWKDVKLTTDRIIAPSVERIKEALGHINITRYDREGI